MGENSRDHRNTRSEDELVHIDLLREAADNFRAVLASIPLGLAILDENLEIQAVNSRLQEFLGFASEELVGKKISEVVLDLDISSIAPGGEAGRKAIALDKSGESIPVEIFVNQSPCDDGNFLFLHFRDIRESERLDRLKRDFIAMISHDVRSPLSSIYGIVTMAATGRYGPLSDECLKAMKRAQIGAEYVLELVESLLDVELIDSDGLTVDFFETNICYVVDRAVSTVIDLAEQKEVVIIKEVESTSFTGDEERLVQVLVNLLSNAIKLSPRNAPIIVSAHAHGELVRFCVEDAGPGVPVHARSMIFDRFRQLPTSGSDKVGFGLGLAICKGIVELHGGKIWVCSPRERASNSENNSEFCEFEFCPSRKIVDNGQTIDDACKADIESGSRFIFDIPKNQDE